MGGRAGFFQGGSWGCLGGPGPPLRANSGPDPESQERGWRLQISPHPTIKKRDRCRPLSRGLPGASRGPQLPDLQELPGRLKGLPITAFPAFLQLRERGVPRTLRNAFRLPRRIPVTSQAPSTKTGLTGHFARRGDWAGPALWARPFHQQDQKVARLLQTSFSRSEPSAYTNEKVLLLTKMDLTEFRS